MPHVTIQHFPKPLTAEQQARLVERLTAAVQEAFEVDESAISIALAPVTPEDWDAEVYQPAIAAHREDLAKAPGY